MERTLQEEFEYVRQTFFPLWDRKREWRVELVEDIDGAQGKCLLDTKTILICEKPPARVALQLLLVHEMCHAFSGDHQKKWQNRMMKVAHRASDLDMTTLANGLRKEVKIYREAPRMTADMMYSAIFDAVLERPDSDFDTIVDRVRREYGYTKEEFLHGYLRAEREYQKAKEVVAANRRGRAT